MARQIRAKKLRPMLQFAEEELVLPTGPFEGHRYRADRNPFGALWLNAVDSGLWRRFFFTGVQQAGKTWHGSVIPVIYHLFEVGETVIFGLPSLDMVSDKWNEDLKPAIERTQFKELLPRSGPGSRGGNVRRITFGNGATLRFMTGGGRDKTRAGYTARVCVTTEVDGMDEAGSTSRETDKIAQLEGRTSAFGDHARFYGECTVSIDKGRTWREYKGGTESSIAIRCQHCRQFVTPEREHLVGWQDAADVDAAAEKASLVCPGCGATWTEAERIAANRDCRLLHRGQTINDAGEISGEAPRTNTLGFRFNAANNLLVPISVVAQREWKAARHPDEELAEREMRQFVWAIPCEKQTIDLSELDWQLICKRTTHDPIGRVPSDTVRLGLGVDLGKWLLHWTLIAIRADGSPHVVEYGRQDVPSRDLGTERALLSALRELRDRCDEGWQSDDGVVRPDFKFLDAGEWDEVVFAFCAEAGRDWIPCKGFGFGQRKTYTAPRQTNETIAFIGNGYYLARLPKKHVWLCHVDANAWKTRTHDGLNTPVNRAGAMTLFKADPKEHISYAKHLTAEKKEQNERRVVWKRVNKSNHFLDSTSLAQAAADFAGQRAAKRRLPKAQDPPSPATTVGSAEGQDELVEPGSADNAVADDAAGGTWWGARKKKR
jgi:phage terminase large subunit GpA-like protein